jgi:hypothetical protein
VRDGKAYLVFSSSDTLSVATSMDGNIWIARVDSDPEDPLVHMRANERPTYACSISGGCPMQVRPRLEAEVYFGGGSPMVYYSQLTETGDAPWPDGCGDPVQGGFLRNQGLRRATVTLP